MFCVPRVGSTPVWLSSSEVSIVAAAVAVALAVASFSCSTGAKSFESEAAGACGAAFSDVGVPVLQSQTQFHAQLQSHGRCQLRLQLWPPAKVQLHVQLQMP